MTKALRIILNNQLSENISCLDCLDQKNDVIFMCEAKEEYTFVKHHKKKIDFFISAMRHFAQELKGKGYNLLYTKLDDSNNSGIIKEEILKACKVYKPERVIVTWPADYRTFESILALEKELGDLSIHLEIREDNNFLSSRKYFQEWATNRKGLLMESFYRKMRKEHNILMQDGKPVGGKWNYDTENRKFPQKKVSIPKPFSQPIDDITKECLRLVQKKFKSHFGDLEPFYFAVTRKQALEALKVFINERLESFGEYQDAMIEGEPWMYHSHLSFYLNCSLLNPLECINAAQDAYYEGRASINAVEGFIRQILGWREYMSRLYWFKMPKYKDLNFLEAKRTLPKFYWDGNTSMNCLKNCINETKQHAYAHHIQRLMVLGNFALIAGIDPKEVNEWYLIVYADAFEWVELPNVTGMILYADGGLLGSKPYAASGAYINKMSDYCKNCTYNVREKNGSQACPFNYLYWDFLARNEEKLKDNQRLKMVYTTLRRMSTKKREAIKSDAENFFNKL